MVALGNKMPQWVEQGVSQYARRIHGKATLEIREIPAIRRGKNADLARIMQHEEARIVKAIPSDYRIIALHRSGQCLDTLMLSQTLSSFMDEGSNVALVIGGPEGLSEQFVAGASASWSLSAMTYAHPVVRIMLAEQLYRGLCILDGTPYHR